MPGIGSWEIQSSPQVLIGVPHTGLVTMEWVASFKSLQHPPAAISYSRGTPIDHCRNALIDQMFGTNCEYIFFLDSDIVAPPDTILRLMNHHLPVVSAIYWIKHPTPLQKPHPALWRENAEKQAVPVIDHRPGELLEVDFVGCGALLVHRKVFERIEKPYFRWTVGFEKDGMSEDFTWCKKVRAAGFKIFCDTSLVCRHVSFMNVSDRGIEFSSV